MKSIKEIDEKIGEFPDDLAYLAKKLMSDLDKGVYSKSEIEDRLRQVIKELVLEDMDK